MSALEEFVCWYYTWENDVLQGSEESHAPGKGANDAKEALMSVVAPLHLMRYVLSRPIGEEDWKN